MEVSVNIKGGKNWKNILKKIGDQTFNAKVGIFNSTYSGQYNTDTHQSVAEVAFWHEYGTDNIPARAPFRTTSTLKETTWANALANQLKGNPMGVEAALWNVGDKIAKDLQQSVLDNELSPPLKEKTIKYKEKEGFTSPGTALLRTGTLIRSIIPKVERV